MRSSVLALAVVSCSGPSVPRVHLFIWAKYISPDVIRDFETSSGIQVIEENYESEEKGLAKLRQVPSHYDLMVVSNEQLPAMIREGLASPIDVPNLRHLDPRFDRPGYGIAHDPQGRRVAVPYMWGTVGICYNSDKIRLEDPPSWSALWDERFKGRIIMFDQMTQSIPVALKFKRHSVNSVDDASLADALDALRKQYPLVKYKDDEYRNLLKSEDAWISMAWNGDVAKDSKEKPSLKYAVPKEGSTVWVDHLVLLDDSSSRESALRFVDYLMQPAVNAKNAEYLSYATCNLEARKSIPSAMLQDRVIYPDEETLRRCEFRRDLGDAIAKYRKIWDAVKGN